MREFINQDSLRKIVAAELIGGSVHFVGEIVDYCKYPTVGIKKRDGTVAHWRADLCSSATEEQVDQYQRDSVDYWRRRAQKAEREIEKFTTCESTRQP